MITVLTEIIHQLFVTAIIIIIIIIHKHLFHLLAHCSRSTWKWVSWNTNLNKV